MSLEALNDLVAVDTETTGLSRWHGDRPFAVSFCDSEGNTHYIRWEVDPFTREVLADPDDLRALFKFFRSGRRFVFHHGKFDVMMLDAFGVKVPAKTWDDTLVAFRCVKTDEPTYGLKPLAKRYADYEITDEKDLKKATIAARRQGKKEGWKIHEDVPADYWMADPELCARYAIQDAERTMLLWILVQDRIQEVGVQATYALEMEIQQVTMDMERHGVAIDLPLIKSAQTELGEKLSTLFTELESASWDGFNPNSPQQKIKLLYERLGLRPRGWTKSGAPATDKTALEKLNHPVAKLLLEYSNLSKQLQFYVQWESQAVEEGGQWVIHPTFNPQAADTGRFSCSNPNLQQVPSRDPEAAARARRPFIPRPGHVWIACDYSQMELRMLASQAHEEGMLNAFRNGADIHEETAYLVFGSRDKKHRRDAKDINFGISYGAGAEKIGETSGKSTYEAQQNIDRYFGRFPGIQRYMEEMIGKARADGHIINPYGRRIDIPRQKLYTALNYDIQSSGADVCKRAMLRTAPLASAVGGHLVLQIHDEIVFEIPREAATPQLLRQIRDEMEAAAEGKFQIPLGVDVSYCEESWADKQDVVLDAVVRRV